MPSTRYMWRNWLGMMGLIGLIFMVSLPLMLRDALWLDEVYTHLYSGTGGTPRLSFMTTVLYTAQFDKAWPPLYYLIQNIWGRISGDSLIAGHLLPSLFGSLTLAMTYRFGRDLFDHRTGLIAAILTGTSAIFINFTHETRAYTLYTFFIVLMLWFYWQILTRRDYERRWLRWGFPLSIAGALYSHYVAGAFVLAIMGYHLWMARPSAQNAIGITRERWLNIIRLWMNGCLLFAPWLGVLLTHALFERGSSRSSSLLEIVYYALYSFTNRTWWVIVPMMFTGLLAWRRRTVRFLWVWLGLSIVLIGIMNSLVSFLFHPRHFLGLLPIMTLLIAVSLLRWSAKLAWFAVAIWASMGLFFAQQVDFLGYIEKHAVPLPITLVEAAQALGDQCVRDEDVVIFSMANFDKEHDVAPPFRLYYFANVPYAYVHLGSLLSDAPVIDELPEALKGLPYEARVTETIQGVQRVWVFANQLVDLRAQRATLNDQLISAGYQACGIVQEADHLAAEIYAQTASCDALVRACSVSD